MGNFRGVTFSAQNVTPKNDGALYNAHYGDGILEGCTMAISGDDLVIQSGHIIACGRECQVDGATNVDLSGRTLQTGYIQVLLNYDLTQGEGQQWYTTFVESATTTFPAITQEDINTPTGTLYQLELAVIQVSGGNLTSIYNFIGGSNLFVRGEPTYNPTLSLDVSGNGHGHFFYDVPNTATRIWNQDGNNGLAFSDDGSSLFYANNTNIVFRPKGRTDGTNQVTIDNGGQMHGGNYVDFDESSTTKNATAGNYGVAFKAFGAGLWLIQFQVHFAPSSGNSVFGVLVTDGSGTPDGKIAKNTMWCGSTQEVALDCFGIANFTGAHTVGFHLYGSVASSIKFVKIARTQIA